MESRDTIQRQLTPEQAAARREEIAEMYVVRRWTLQRIADFCGISRQRVHQLMQRWRSENDGASHA